MKPSTPTVMEQARKIIRTRAKMLREEILPELGLGSMTKEEAILLVLAELMEKNEI